MFFRECRFDSCHADVNETQKQKRELSRANHKRKVVSRYKTIKGCVDCGYNANAYALEFDHLPGFEKDRTVASLMYASWNMIKKEIAKCEVVCANCHAIRTFTRKT